MVSIKDWCVLETPFLVLSWTAQLSCHQICTEIEISFFMFQKRTYKHVFSIPVWLSFTLSYLRLQHVLRYLHSLLIQTAVITYIYILNATAYMGSLSLYIGRGPEGSTMHPPLTTDLQLFSKGTLKTRIPNYRTGNILLWQLWLCNSAAYVLN